MKLKSLEIYGFKSFADKTVLSFGDGITAVVGPNGSGKSNISDAVRWVLGEQSNKTLRSLKMENVIFGGTAKRKQLGYAEVTLVIDNSDRNINCDSDEITVTRRYYRSGDSEYKINNATVRLKDVHELFMDTGLGRDGYSMVGQGKIDNIIDTKTSEERRDIFEEAAGISRYRYRKTEAERKLKNAEENLVRLKDILSELEDRVGPLKSQSEKAQKFLELAKEQEYLQIGIWMNTISKYKDQLREQELKIIAAREQYDEIVSTSEKTDAELDETTELMQKLIVLADTARKNASLYEEQAAVLEGDIAVSKNNIYHNNVTIERIESELSDLNQGDNDVNSEIENKSKLIEQKQIQLKNAEELLNETNNLLLNLVNESDEFSSKIEDLNSKLNKMSVEVSECLVKKMAAQSAKDEINKRVLSIEESINAKNNKSAELNNEITLLNQDLKDCDERIDECTNSLSGRQMLLNSRKEKVNKLKEEIYKLKLDESEKRRRAKILEELEKNMEGFAHAIKFVMSSKNKGLLKGIHNTVASLISVDKKYAVAIEIALGNAIQNIVTDNENDAKRAISMLKDNSAGRATFLPLNAIKPRFFTEKGLDNCDGFVGIAAELVKADKKYDIVISKLLGEIVIVEDLDSAVSIAKKYNYRFKIVTLEGQVVNSGGSMTGGSLGKQVGILSRANDIKQYILDADKILDNIKVKEQNLDKLISELSVLEAELVESESVIKTAQEDKIRVLGEIKRVTEQIDSNNFDLEQLGNEKSELNEKIQDYNLEINNSDLKITEINALSNDVNAELTSLTNGRDDTSIKREKLNLKSTEIRNNIFEIKKDIEIYEENVNQLVSKINGQQEKTNSLQNEISELKNQNMQIENTVAELENKVANLRKQAEESNNSVKTYYEKRDELEKQSNSKRAEQKDFIEQRERLSGELVRLEERKVSMVHNYDDIIQKLFDEYGLTKSEAEEKNIVLESITQAQLRLSELKRSIKALGNVNVSAIEEYKQVSQRYEYLSSEINDIEKTKDELYKFITQLVAQMQDLFLEKFSAINAYFQKIFTELFGGGTAEFRLTEPDNVLESGIEILAQPPGKNVTIIEQLSGGEKALIAISIYFAVMKVNPPPFCILDEVDAALDDVNVSRFAEYLRKMCSNTQYIVITHRRGTMEEADILYGVTMQEKGVTRLLELDVAQAEKNLSLN
ncbi:MAG: chromosome segregation protein SMC [Acutalibacteraceae bacterium]|nr:chromosome segregation protein SMC [Acutalibacteraceae bacterium]